MEYNSWQAALPYQRTKTAAATTVVHKRNSKPPRVTVQKRMKPDFWFGPVLVLEVKGAEITKSLTHSCGWDEKQKEGLAFRFPRFQRRREKDPEQATTTNEVIEMYRKK